MEIKQTKIKIRDLITGFKEDEETESVVGYGGKLDIRPPYQREFIYKDAEQNAVINSILHGFPLNTIYWAKTGEDTFEVLDGQQRIMSICRFCKGKFSFKEKYFNSLREEQDKILDYELDVYQCQGTDKEKLNWFKIINIAGEELAEQELRNAIYHGKWTTNAKRIFSKTNGKATKYKDFLKGSQDRQDWLETALKWNAEKEGEKVSINEFMAKHINQDSDAEDLWYYFEGIIKWILTIFPDPQKASKKYQSLIKSVDWGKLYLEYKDNKYNKEEVAQDFTELMEDSEIKSPANIFEFILAGKDPKKENILGLRTFDNSIKKKVYKKQGGICPHCHHEGGKDKDKIWAIEEMEADHIKPWREGGKTEIDNCQMLCKRHNREKGGK